MGFEKKEVQTPTGETVLRRSAHLSVRYNDIHGYKKHPLVLDMLEDLMDNQGWSDREVVDAAMGVLYKEWSGGKAIQNSFTAATITRGIVDLLEEMDDRIRTMGEIQDKIDSGEVVSPQEIQRARDDVKDTQNTARGIISGAANYGGGHTLDLSEDDDDEDW